jgi:DNA-binding XRE family transcriptional regulator
MTPEHLRATRRAAGVTQAALAATLGVTADAVRRWESGARRPARTDAEILAALARAAKRRSPPVLAATATDRQRAAADLVAAGLSYRAAGEVLGVSGAAVHRLLARAARARTEGGA